MSGANAGSRKRSRWRWPALVLLLLTGLQIWARFRIPLVAFGANGAELIPHLQRQYALHHLEQHGFGMFLHPWFTLRALDGHYPALLHVLAAGWSQLQGSALVREFALAAHLNLPFLAALAWAVAQLAASPNPAGGEPEGSSPNPAGGEPGGSSPNPAGGEPEGSSPGPADGEPGGSSPGPAGGKPEGSSPGPLPIVLALLIPGLYGAARRYYYDLPMTVMILIAAAALLGGRGLASPGRALGAALATAGALLFKWAAALYLGPIWLLGFLEPLRQKQHARAWLQGIAALGLTTALCVPVATVPGGSFEFERRVGSSPPGPGPTLTSGLAFYAEALWSAGLGPGLTGLLVISSLLALLNGDGRRTLGRVAWVTLPPLLYLADRVPVRDGRYLMPLLPWMALVMAAGVRVPGGRRARYGAMLCGAIGLLQVAWIDGLVSWRSNGEGGPGQPEGQPRASMASPASEVRSGGEAVAFGNPFPGGAPPASEAWRGWWWTGMRSEVPSPVHLYERMALEAIALAPGGRLLVASAGAAPTSIHAWQYFLNALPPGGSSLVAPPAAPSASAFVEAIGREVDVVVAAGPEGSPERIGAWLEAVSRQPVESAEVPARFFEIFPERRRVVDGRLEVHLYGRRADGKR